MSSVTEKPTTREMTIVTTETPDDLLRPPPDVNGVYGSVALALDVAKIAQRDVDALKPGEDEPVPRAWLGVELGLRTAVHFLEKTLGNIEILLKQAKEKV
jgi:hypothetical protein